MNQDQYCENCIHFSPQLAAGTCRRYAPQAYISEVLVPKLAYGIWPFVQTNDFCGEWKEIPTGEFLKNSQIEGKIILQKVANTTVIDDSQVKAVVP